MRCFKKHKEDLPDGHRIVIKWYYDHTCGPPHEHEDGHVVVYEAHKTEKRQGDSEIAYLGHGRSLFLDHRASMEKALREGWGLPPKEFERLSQQLERFATEEEMALSAVMLDADYIRDWYHDRWHWCWYRIKIKDPGGRTVYRDTLGGIDSPSLEEFQEEAVENAKYWLDKELAEQQDAAARGIITI